MTTTTTPHDLHRLLGADPEAVAAGLARNLLDNRAVYLAVQLLSNRLNDLGVSTSDADAIQGAILGDTIAGQLAANLARVLKEQDHAPRTEATPV